jgi:hypothetical protein
VRRVPDAVNNAKEETGRQTAPVVTYVRQSKLVSPGVS